MTHPSNFIDLTGKKFGTLTAIEYLGNRKWLVNCDCGEQRAMLSLNLKRQNKTCGGYAHGLPSRKTHGYTHKSTHDVWRGMLQRCNDPNTKAYIYYGAKGVKVCDRWHKFENFLSDMGEKLPGTMIDRINSNGDYEPQNCIWTTRFHQNRNKSSNVNIEWNGKIQCLKDWSTELGIQYKTLYARVQILKWSIQEAFTQPCRYRN